MVLLTMTPAIVTAVKKYKELEPDTGDTIFADSAMSEPAVGKPISHAQVITLWKSLNQLRGDRATSQGELQDSYHLDDLLRGSKIYVPPPKPKPEPTSEYTALMARLRKDEEARAYDSMVNPLRAPQSFTQHLPPNSNTHLLNSSGQLAKEEEDETTYADVNRQLTLIINVLISIVTCSIAIWLAARKWSTPWRLSLSMGGSVMVAIAEVVIYAGYLRRMQEAKSMENKRPELKEIMETWIIDRDGEKSEGSPRGAVGAEDPRDANLRHRKGKHKENRP